MKFVSAIVFCLFTFSLHGQEILISETNVWPEVSETKLPTYFQDSYEIGKSLLTYSEEPKIPKLIHQIWVGPKPIPSGLFPLMDSWQQHHPDWEYKLWTDSEVADFELYNQKAYDSATNYGMKADILRIEILYRYGGLYVDIDQLCLKPHDIFHHLSNLYCGILHSSMTNVMCVSNAVIGAKPGHPILLRYMTKLQEKVEKRGNQPLNLSTREIQYFTGPFFFNDCVKFGLKEHSRDDSVIVFPKPFFFPLKDQLRDPKRLPSLESLQEFITPYTYGVQYHTATWMK